MTETTIIALLAAGGVLWAVGGSGLKFLRRFLWPVLCAGLLAFSGVSLLTSLGVCLGLIVVSSAPYGDSTPWPLRIAVFAALPAPALAINMNAWPWVLACGLLVSGLAFATRKWNAVSQKLFEFGAGAIQAGVIVIASLM